MGYAVVTDIDNTLVPGTLSTRLSLELLRATINGKVNRKTGFLAVLFGVFGIPLFILSGLPVETFRNLGIVYYGKIGSLLAKKEKRFLKNAARKVTKEVEVGEGAAMVLRNVLSGGFPIIALSSSPRELAEPFMERVVREYGNGNPLYVVASDLEREIYITERAKHVFLEGLKRRGVEVLVGIDDRKTVEGHGVVGVRMKRARVRRIKIRERVVKVGNAEVGRAVREAYREMVEFLYPRSGKRKKMN